MFCLTDGVFFLLYTDTYIDVIYLNKKFYEKKKKLKKKIFDYSIIALKRIR